MTDHENSPNTQRNKINNNKKNHREGEKKDATPEKM